MIGRGPGQKRRAVRGAAAVAALAPDSSAQHPADDTVAGDPDDESSSAPARQATFASLAIPDFRRLFILGLFMFLAVNAQQIARGQLAYDITQSNVGLGGVYMSYGVPMLLFGPWGGVAADRFAKRTMMIVALVFFVVSSGWITVAVMLDVLEYWMLLGAGAIQGFAISLANPARVAITGEVVPRHLIGNGVVLTQMSTNSTRVVGPGIAGALIAIKGIGASGAYLFTTILFAGALVAAFRLPARAPRRTDVTRSVVGEFVDGVRYARRHPLLRMLIVSASVMIMASFPYMVFLPAVSNDLFDKGAGGYGLMSSVTAVAAVISGLLIAGRMRPNNAWRVQLISGVLLAVGLTGIAIAPTFVVCLAALFIVGGATASYQATNNTIALTLADLEFHGRVQSLLFLSISFFTVAALPLGAVADGVGLRAMFAGMGAVCAVTIALYALAQRRARRRGISLELETSPA